MTHMQARLFYGLGMVCPDTALTCAVRQISESLESGPSVFEYFVQLVVPLVVALATLAVALASLKVARQSNALAAQVRADESARDLLREREPFAREVSTWISKRAMEAQGHHPVPTADDLGVGVQLAAVSQRSPFADALVTAVSEVFERLERDDTMRPDLVEGACIHLVRWWTRDPEAWGANYATKAAGRRRRGEDTALL